MLKLNNELPFIVLLQYVLFLFSFFSFTPKTWFTKYQTNIIGLKQTDLTVFGLVQFDQMHTPTRNNQEAH